MFHAQSLLGHAVYLNYLQLLIMCSEFYYFCSFALLSAAMETPYAIEESTYTETNTGKLIKTNV